MRRLLAIVALTIGLLVAAAVPVEAAYVDHWQYWGWRFYNGRVCVELNTSRDWLRAATVEAVDDWSSHTHLVTYVRPDCTGQTITIRAAGFGDTGWVGRVIPTSRYWGSTPAGNWTWILRTARVDLNLTYSHHTATQWGRIITHELGHAYGLAHATKCGSVMKSGWTCAVYEIGLADRRSLNQIYAQ